MLISNIQLLRAIAASLVVVFHLMPHFKQAGGLLAELYWVALQFAYAGVDVFFVISGYVIWISSRTYQSRGGSGHFLYNRACRIYLGYWPYFLLALLIFTLAGKNLDAVDFVGSWFLTQTALHQLLLQVSWTLTYELYFYLTFSLLMLAPARYLPVIIKTLFVLIVVVQAVGMLALDFYAPERFPETTLLLTFFTSPLCLEFLAGCLLGVFFQTNRLAKIWPWVMAATVVFAVGLWYQSTYLLPNALMSQGYFMPQRALFWGTVSVILVAVFVELEHRKQVFLPKTARLTGGASYSIYLSHIPIIFLFQHFGLFKVDSARLISPGWMALIAFGCIIAYSVVHYLLIEKPLMKGARWIWRVLTKPVGK